MAVLGGNPLVWRVGLAVAWLVGSWLFGPKQNKNKIFDPGAQEMPRWNTALRGIIIPVLFGTNRVSCQVIWQHDYNAVRTESKQGGGGKLGGSGGGKGGAQTGSISYEYYWDLIYHLGMVPERYSLIKGWLGAQRINNEAMTAIIGGNTGAFVFTDVNDPNQKNDAKVTMSFEDSIFYTGSGPALDNDSDPIYDGWSEILSDEGVEVRWPHTTYVGFKQLDLGSYPSVPQMSFELGPGSTTITIDSGLIDYDTGVAGVRIPGGTSMFKGEDGLTYYVYNSGGSTSIHRVDLNTGVDTPITVGSVKDYLQNYGVDFDGLGLTLVGNGGFAVLDPFNYLFVPLQATSAGVDWWVAWGIFKIDYSGTLVCCGAGIEHVSNSLSTFILNSKLTAISGNRKMSDPIISVATTNFVTSWRVNLYTFPSLDDNLDTVIQINDSTIGDQNIVQLTDIDAVNYPLSEHGSYRNYKGFFWSVPKVNGLEIETRIFYYLGQADLQAAIDNFGQQNTWVDSVSANYTQGAICYFDTLPSFSTASHAPSTVGAQVIDNSSILYYGTNSPVVPFSDRLLFANGTTVGSTAAFGDYDPHPFCHKIPDGPNAGAYVVIFAQQLEDNTEDQVNSSGYSTYIRARICYWDMINLKHYQLQATAFQPYDRTTDLGSNDTVKFVPWGTMVNYWPDNGNLYGQGGSYNVSANQIEFFGEAGNAELAGGDDVTPPYVIHEILTSPIFGIGLTEAQIDQTTYLAAIDYCTENNFYISVQYRREESVLQTIDDLLSCYGGFLVISNGVVKFKQLEYLDGLAAPVRTIDNDHLIKDGDNAPVQITKGALQDTFNKVRVNYFDRKLEYAQNQVEEADEVDQDLNGIRMREFPAIFVMKEEMARTMATRALWSNLYSRDTYEFKLGWKDCDLEPGDVITLVDSYHTQLQGGAVCRIIEWKEDQRGMFSITAKQELLYVLATSAEALNITSASVMNVIGIIPQVQDFTMYEMPPEYSQNGGAVYVSWASYEFASGANLWISADGETFANVQNIEPYQINGKFLTDLPANAVMNENVEVLMSPKSDWYATGSYYYTQTLNDAEQSTRAAGGSLIWCGSEMMEYEGVNFVATNRYRFDKLFRGIGGSNKHSHSSGDLFYKQGGGVFYQNIVPDRIGNIVYYKVQPHNLAGAAVNIASIAAKSYTIQGKYWLPVPQGQVEYNANRGKTTFFVNSTVDIPIDWTPADALHGYGHKGYGYGGYGADTINSNNFRIVVYGSGGAAVRSTSVVSPSFTYTSSMNAQDNGAWYGRPAFAVYPTNEYGSGLQASVISLSLW